MHFWQAPYSLVNAISKPVIVIWRSAHGLTPGLFYFVVGGVLPLAASTFAPGPRCGFLHNGRRRDSHQLGFSVPRDSGHVTKVLAATAMTRLPTFHQAVPVVEHRQVEGAVQILARRPVFGSRSKLWLEDQPQSSGPGCT